MKLSELGQALALKTLLETERKKLGDLTINGEVVSLNGRRRPWWEGDLKYRGSMTTAYNNKIDSLEGAPTNVSGDFDCSQNALSSLAGAPNFVGGEFICRWNYLSDLTGAPTHVGDHFICGNNKLTSIEGAPVDIGGSFSAIDADLRSLHDVHKHLKKIKGGLYFSDNPIKSHVLGVLLVKGCTFIRITNKQLEKILNKYLPTTEGIKGMLRCQRELIKAGFEEEAQL